MNDLVRLVLLSSFLAACSTANSGGGPGGDTDSGPVGGEPDARGSGGRPDAHDVGPSADATPRADATPGSGAIVMEKLSGDAEWAISQWPPAEQVKVIIHHTDGTPVVSGAQSEQVTHMS